MRAIVYDGTSTSLLDGITLAEPGPLDVVVDIAAAGLCQSDLSYMAGSTSAFAEQTLVGENQCVKIPDDVPLTSAALVGCGVVTGVGAVMNRARVRHGETAVVFGVGGVGLNVIQAPRISGASTIVAVDTVADKEPLARQFGATHFVDGTHDDVVAEVGRIAPETANADRGWFNSGGVDWAFDCVAHPDVTWNALECLDWGGTVVVVGVASQTAEFRGLYTRLSQVERGIMGCRYGSISAHRDISRIIEMYRRGELLLDELVTATHPVEDWERAVDELKSGTVARGVITFA